ncbi:MAG: hypothetical protein C0501_00840 [Isosphaera sp.]|nr:hypothetical protein [Isosphaera sp.]
MARWYRKRWAWAVLVGATAVGGLTPAGWGTDAPPAPPKVGDVISLKFRDGPDRQVKVVKTEKQPDGSYLSEVKDTKSGETFTLVDRPGDAPPPPAGAKTAEPTKDAAKAKPAAAKEMPADPAKDRKPLVPALAKPGTPEPEPEKPGLLKRLFGRKPATPPAPAATTTSRPPAPAAPPAPALPPAVRPTPAPVAPPVVGGTGEPPRVMPARPLPPVVPVAPPAPAPLPTIPTGPAGLPPIPVAPGGVSAAAPAVVPAGRTVAAAADPVVVNEIRPFVEVLKTEASPGLRLQAVRGLSGCRHATTDVVKGVLFKAAAEDGHPAVRACCVRELCALGYHDPAFLTHLTHASADPDPGVRAAAKEALAKLTRRE